MYSTYLCKYVQYLHVHRCTLTTEAMCWGIIAIHTNCCYYLFWCIVFFSSGVHRFLFHMLPSSPAIFSSLESSVAKGLQLLESFQKFLEVFENFLKTLGPLFGSENFQTLYILPYLYPNGVLSWNEQMTHLFLNSALSVCCLLLFDTK